MLSDEYEKFIDEITKSAKHGVGMGISGVNIARYYFFKGIGKYKPDSIHKDLFPCLKEIEVKLAWLKDKIKGDDETYMMVDVVFREEEKEKDCCAPSEHFGFKCVCTDHGGSIKLKSGE